MNLPKNKLGFTLIEIMIVVIIVGVLASLAMPRFFATIEFSRSQEALGAIASVRGGLERYYVQQRTYVGATTSNIDTGDPLAGQANAHFALAVGGQSATGYVITATRNTRDGVAGGDTVAVTQTATAVTRAGTGAFAGIN